MGRVALPTLRGDEVNRIGLLTVEVLKHVDARVEADVGVGEIDPSFLLGIRHRPPEVGNVQAASGLPKCQTHNERIKKQGEEWLVRTAGRST